MLKDILILKIYIFLIGKGIIIGKLKYTLPRCLDMTFKTTDTCKGCDLINGSVLTVTQRKDCSMGQVF